MIARSQGRLQDRQPVSIIDIGSNSIRLVVYEGIARSPTVLFNEKMLAGLGRGIANDRQARPGGGDAFDGRIPPLSRAFRSGGRYRSLCYRHRRSARGGERSGFHPPRRKGARHQDQGAVGARGGLFLRARHHLRPSIQPTGSREISAAAASNSSMSGARTIGDGITLPLGGLRLQDMAKNSLAAAAKIAKTSWCAPNC